MRIDSRSVSPTKTRVTEKALNKSLTGTKAGAPLERAQSGLKDTDLFSRSEIMTLASNLKDGTINRDEASQEFINGVVNRCVDKLSENDRKRLIKDITDFFSHDQQFLSQLEKSLRAIT